MVSTIFNPLTDLADPLENSSSDEAFFELLKRIKGWYHREQLVLIYGSRPGIGTSLLNPKRAR